MTFVCVLERPTRSCRCDSSGALRDDLDYQSTVMEACALLAETDCRFTIGGFGQDDWRLDVAYDLSAVVEQLPDILAGLRRGDDVELDLYPQGIERTLRFSAVADEVVIRCFSGTSWVPRPDVEAVSLAELESMLARLAVDFAASLEVVAPGLCAVAPFSGWLVGNV